MEIVSNNSVSPFDAIKQVNSQGAEFWSARDLMPILGYDRWENFDASIERAKYTALNQGQPVETLFRGVTKKSLLGRPKADYELSRYAAYLVAMNGDPRKPEIAAAQSYFAIQTRVAETTPVKELTGAELMAKALIEAQNVLAQKDERIAQLEPAATAYGHWNDDNLADFTFRALSKKLIEHYPGMTETKLREHMLKRRELGRVYYYDKKKDERVPRYVPNTEMMRRGWATERKVPSASGRLISAYKYTPAYYEELVKRFSKTLTSAGQQELLEVA